MMQPTATVPLDPAFGVAGGLRSIFSVLVVLALVAALAWLVRRGTLRLPGGHRHQAMTIESATPLGDRRSLVIVTVEGRRLLLGLTPMAVSLVSELGPRPADFDQTLRTQVSGPEQQP